MDRKKIGKTLLFPPMAVLFLLIPVAFGMMLYGMFRLGQTHPVTVAGYVLAFYTTAVWAVRVPRIIRFFKTFKEENKYTRVWFENHRLRINVILCGNVLWNGGYGVLQLCLGAYHGSDWFYAAGTYYLLLALIRFFLVRHTLRCEPGKEQRKEHRYYRGCGWALLLMNIALSGMIFFTIRENRVTEHHEITTIAMASYTFTALTLAVVNLFRYRKYHSPVISAVRAVSLTAACVSMLSLENTMLATFDSGEMADRTRRLFLSLSGGAISFLIVAIAIYMIANANKKLRISEKENGK